MYSWFLIYVGVNGLLVTLLAMNVSRNRIKYRIGNGDGGNIELEKAIRVHGNAVEHSILFGLVVLALAMLEVTKMAQSIFVVGFTVARLLHALSMIQSAFNVRRVAAGATYTFELAGCVAVIYLAATTWSA